MTLLIATLLAAGLLLVLVILMPKRALGHGRLFGFVAIGVLPVLAAWMGFAHHVEHSKTTEFCASCHVMEAYRASLNIDDVMHIPASHFQSARVPHETACFTCHTTYTMYGDVSAKLRGLRHIWVQYLGTIPTPIKLYSPYSNRECLHCHERERSFLEATPHTQEGNMKKILSNERSCVAGGCHDVVHDVASLPKLKMWQP